MEMGRNTGFNEAEIKRKKWPIWGRFVSYARVS